MNTDSITNSKKTEFLEVSPGNKSNSRRIAWCAFWVGSVFAGLILLAGLLAYVTAKTPEMRPDLLAIAGAAGVMFGSIAGSAMAYTFFTKTQEPKTI